MLRCVLFDFGGTLDYDGQTWLDRFYPLFVQAGVKASLPEFQKAYYRADDAMPVRHDLRQASLEQTLLFLVQDILAIVSPDQAASATKIAGAFLEESRRHFSRNRKLLERLRGRYVLGIVSNFYGNIEAVLRGEGLLEFFGAVADSGAIGSQKPAPQIFEHAMQGLGVQAGECLMVGDSLPRDMRGAEGLGMAHAWIGGGAASCCSAGKTISQLPELEALLA